MVAADTTPSGASLTVHRYVTRVVPGSKSGPGERKVDDSVRGVAGQHPMATESKPTSRIR